MAQLLLRANMIPDFLLENLRLREPSFGFAVPDQEFLDLCSTLRLMREVHSEKSSRRGYECDLANGSTEGREQLLPEVGGSEQPFALCAVCDGYPWEDYGCGVS